MKRKREFAIPNACVATFPGAAWVALSLLVLLMLWLPARRAEACSMSALMAVQGSTLDQYAQVGPAFDYAKYDDPWDYLGFVMARSHPAANSDGYGVIAYTPQNAALEPRNVWYKRVNSLEEFNSVYYTGQYLNPQSVGDEWDHDVLDEALLSLRSGEVPASIVLSHARSATGMTLGNHPFWLHDRGRSFSFMHNGVCNSARAFMIARINEMYPGGTWFVQNPSNHFGDTDPTRWVDSEVLFHYLVANIRYQGNNVMAGLHRALLGIRPYLENAAHGVYNFVLSDGERLYVFRSSSVQSSYRLSYKFVRGGFYGIRTDLPQSGDISLRPRELVVFMRDRPPAHYPDFSRSGLHLGEPDNLIPGGRQLQNSSTPLAIAHPNPFLGSVSLRYQTGWTGLLTLRVFNARGEKLWETVRELNAPGTIDVTWPGKDGEGREVPAGVYFLRVDAGQDRRSFRVVKLR